MPARRDWRATGTGRFLPAAKGRKRLWTQPVDATDWLKRSAELRLDFDCDRSAAINDTRCSAHRLQWSVEVLNADLALSADVLRIEGVLSQDASITLLINHHDITKENEIGAAIALGVTAPVCLSYALTNGFVDGTPEQ